MFRLTCSFHVAALLALFLLPASAARGDSVVKPLGFLPATVGESGRSFRTAYTQRDAVLADRMVYFGNEKHGRFLVMFLGRIDGKTPGDELSIELELAGEDGRRVVAMQTLTPVPQPKLAVQVNTQALAPDRYVLKATLRRRNVAEGITAQASFERSAAATPPMKWPDDGVTLHLHPAPSRRSGTWPITTGVPLPKALFADGSELVLLEDGTPIPAQWITRATWSPDGFAKWLGLDFQARYRDGQPATYRLVRRPGAAVDVSPLTVAHDEQVITVVTGPARFEISRTAFAGISRAWIGDDQLVDGAGGPYVVDQNGTRYEARLAKDAVVEVEEAGPLRVAVVAKGAFRSAGDRELCKFVTRLWFFAGRSEVKISHRTINTIPDLYVDTRLSDVGFDVITALAPKPGQTMLGVDGKAHVLAAAGSVHQDRGDHCRLLTGDQAGGEGRRADGWISAAVGDGSVGLFLRDMAQRFPKEVALTTDGGADRGVLSVHLWPKHGHVAFDPEQEIARNEIYKVRYAHQGKLLEMRIPQRYHDRLEAFEKEEHWAGGGELAKVNKAGDTKMQASGGQGTVLGGEIWLRLGPATGHADAMATFHDWAQHAPHALPDPAWNEQTDVFGPVAARDAQAFGPAETLLDSAYSFYERAIIEGGQEYGQWIYGGVHNNWEPGIDAANLTRVWQQSHYQNVFQAWLLYFRSARPEHLHWARIHSDQHLDVGVCNHRSYPEGTHSYARFGDIGGAIYHCKGFMPWAGNNSTSGHWIDITNYFARYYLTGDRRGLDMAEQWLRTQTILGGSNAPDVGDPQRYNPREILVPLGELVQYYQATWDVQALPFIEQNAAYLDIPFYESNSPSLSHFGKHWQDWYHELTRDPRTVDRIRQFMDRSVTESPRGAGGYFSFAAFLYHATGDDHYLRSGVDKAYEAVLNLYQSPGERYDQYSLAHNNPAAMLLGRLPLYLHALKQAGMTLTPATGRTVAPCGGGRVDRHDKLIATPRGWPNAGMTVLAVNARPTPVKVVADGPKQFGSFRGHYMLFRHLPVLDPAIASRPQRDALYEHLNRQVVTFPAANLMKDPADQRNITVGRPETPQSFPYVEVAGPGQASSVYMLSYSGDHLEVPVLFDAELDTPMPQVVVIPRESFWNNQTGPRSWNIKGATHVLMRTLDAAAVVHLTVQSQNRRYWMPTTLRISDARGVVVIDSSVFMAGDRPEVTVTLDPKIHPSPWRVEMASSGDFGVTFDGAEELFFAVRQADFDAVLPHLKTPAPSQ